MCGRMTITHDEGDLHTRFGVIGIDRFPKHFNGYPNHDAYPWPVITEEEPKKIALPGSIPRIF